MFYLEDEIPCLRQIYEFDSSFHEIFKINVLRYVANVYKIEPYSYYIIPFGIFEKIEDNYILMRIQYKKSIDEACPDFWSRAKPYTICIQYFQSRKEWKIKKKELFKKYKFQRRMNPEEFNQIYEFTFGIEETLNQ